MTEDHIIFLVVAAYAPSLVFLSQYLWTWALAHGCDDKWFLHSWYVRSYNAIFPVEEHKARRIEERRYLGHYMFSFICLSLVGFPAFMVALFFLSLGLFKLSVFMLTTSTSSLILYIIIVLTFILPLSARCFNIGKRKKDRMVEALKSKNMTKTRPTDEGWSDHSY